MPIIFSSSKSFVSCDYSEICLYFDFKLKKMVMFTPTDVMREVSNQPDKTFWAYFYSCGSNVGLLSLSIVHTLSFYIQLILVTDFRQKINSQLNDEYVILLQYPHLITRASAPVP